MACVLGGVAELIGFLAGGLFGVPVGRLFFRGCLRDLCCSFHVFSIHLIDIKRQGFTEDFGRHMPAVPLPFELRIGSAVQLGNLQIHGSKKRHISLGSSTRAVRKRTGVAIFFSRSFLTSWKPSSPGRITSKFSFCAFS